MHEIVYRRAKSAIVVTLSCRRSFWSWVLPGLVCVAPFRAFAEEAWTVLSNLDGTGRSWSTEAGPSGNVRVTTETAHSGRRSLAVRTVPINQGRAVRQTWRIDVGDLRWSADSRVRFWIKGSRLARVPHGGLIFVEAAGRKGGGDSHWIVPIPGQTYANPEWHQIVLPPVRQATNVGWAPDADGKLDPARIVCLLFVAQQDAPDQPSVPFSFYLDDLEATHVASLPVTYRDATVEKKPDHVTPIWRGFRGRKRAHPAVATFTDVTGWRVAQFGGSRATMVRSAEEPCHEDLRHQAKLTYYSTDGRGHVELVPPEPIVIEGRFNAACAWVYGNNWAWVPDPQTPQVHVWVRLVDGAGQRHRIDLGVINFKFYGWLSKRLRDDRQGDPGHVFSGGPADGRIRFPARLEAIEVRGGIQPKPRTIYIESVALYQDDMPLPALRPELIENLPFPTTPDTILPTVASPVTVTVERQGEAFVLTARGDEKVVWRYVPATGTLSDLTVQVAGRDAFRPCAGSGPAFILAGTQREPTDREVECKLVGAQITDGAVATRWRFACGGDAAEFALTLRAKGKSLIADWSSSCGKAAALRLGRAEDLDKPKLIHVPYMTIFRSGPVVALSGETFLGVLLDWYHTEGSEFYPVFGLEGGAAVVNGGSSYHPLTDGTRNPLGERQFINVSSRFEEILPNIPNPPSTQAAVTREYLYTHLGGIAKDRFEGWLKMWRTYHRKGIRNVLVTHHEDAWSNGADVGQGGQEYTMCIEAAPEVGDAQLIAYCKALRKMGYYVGLYENFTDYNPLGKSWDPRNAARASSGEMRRVWPPTYAIRPLKGLEMALDYPRRVAKKFGTNTAYRDCHTAYPPFGQVDYQAGSPGAGKFATNYRAWGALLMDGHKAYGGPIFSEGGHHWFFAGLVDGNYAQIWMPDAEGYPLLLDFDLRKIHPLEADISMTPGWRWGPGGFWGGLAATIAYGHIGFQPTGDLAEAARYYYLMQQLQRRYTMIPATEIKYHRDGRFYDVTEALKTDAHRSTQVRVRYASGLTVAVNYNPKQRWTVEVGGQRYDLSGYGWAAAGDGFVEFCTEQDGRRIGYVDSPVYRFADGGGKRHDFGPIATDGAVVIRKDDSRGLRLIPLVEATTVSLDAAGSPSIVAYDEADRPIERTDVRWDGHRVTLGLKGVDYFIIAGR